MFDIQSRFAMIGISFLRFIFFQYVSKSYSRKKHAFIIAILTLISFKNNAQNTGYRYLDSMILVCDKHPVADAKKLEYFNIISRESRNFLPEKGLAYSEKAIELAMKLNNQKALAMAEANKGINLVLSGKIELADSWIMLSKKRYEAIGQESDRIENMLDLGVYYRKAGDTVLA